MSASFAKEQIRHGVEGVDMKKIKSDPQLWVGMLNNLKKL
jgi:hypothetical protein